ncbi:MAG: CBS domain-containing protein [candidate division Zixibacteria bacterium]|nr:CBS domain-containing protein [candidate division Zixibacteria bacterium]
MKVNGILKNKRDVISITPDVTIKETMKMLIENKISCLPVMDKDDKLVGIISDKDIFGASYRDEKGFAAATVAELMSTDLIVGVPDDDLNYISGVMTNNRIRHIPIMDDGKLAGLISVGDIIKANMSSMEIENRTLRQYIDGSYPG